MAQKWSRNGEEFHLGLKPFKPNPKDFMLKDLLAVPLPPVPTRNFGYGTMFNNWNMCGNNTVGDCFFAGSDHETMMFMRLGQKAPKATVQYSFNDTTAIDDYAEATGYVIGDPNTDYGTDLQQGMEYRRKLGVRDSHGVRHKIDGYAFIDPGDWDYKLRCSWTFGATGEGFEVPESAMEQFYNGQPWEDVGDTNIVGAHYVPEVGTTKPSDRSTVITWARRQFMTKKFYEKHNFLAVVPLSREQMRASGYNPRHIDWDTLSGMLNAL